MTILIIQLPYTPTMIDTAAFTAHLQKNFPTALEFLKDLVSTNSFTLNSTGVDANAQRVIEQFAPFGFEVRQEPCAAANTGRHLILDSGGDGPAIALISHLDTVFSPEEEAKNDFRWQPDGDRIYGPGTTDIKGGTVMIWMVLDALAALEPELFAKTRWIVLLNAAEEILVPDFRALCLEVLPQDARAALVFEADSKREQDFCLVHSRKGRGSFEVNVTGRNAHAGGYYRDGANAIHQLARVVDRVQALTDLEHETMVNVGKISGGTVTNTVPAFASASLEMRCFEETRYQKVREAILAMNGTGEIKSVNGGHACQVEVKLTNEMAPWPENPATAHLADIWQEAAAACGHQLISLPRGGLSDGNPLWNVFPTIDGLGPRGANVHCAQRSDDGTKEQEYVDATSFEPKALINCAAIKRLLQQPDLA